MPLHKFLLTHVFSSVLSRKHAVGRHLQPWIPACIVHLASNINGRYQKSITNFQKIDNAAINASQPGACAILLHSNFPGLPYWFYKSPMPLEPTKCNLEVLFSTDTLSLAVMKLHSTSQIAGPFKRLSLRHTSADLESISLTSVV